MKVNDKRVVDGAGYIDLGRIIDTRVALNDYIIIGMSMGYEILIDNNELEKLNNWLQKIKAAGDGESDE